MKLNVFQSYGESFLAKSAYLSIIASNFTILIIKERMKIK